MDKRDYAVVYYGMCGVYNVQLFYATDMPLARLNELVDKFNRKKNCGRKAVVVRDKVLVGAFDFFVTMQEDLRSRMKSVEHALYRLENEVAGSSFVKVTRFGEDMTNVLQEEVHEQRTEGHEGA